MFLTDYICEFDLSDVLQTIKGYLAHYDTSALESFSILNLKGSIGFYGICDSPYDSKVSPNSFVSGYRIRCGINESLVFPAKVSASMSTTDLLMLNTSSTHPMSNLTELHNLSEMVLWLAALTIHDYLRLIGGLDNQHKNGETFANNWLMNER